MKFFDRASSRLVYKEIRKKQGLGMTMVNLGCGSTYHNEWINIDFVKRKSDVIAYDLRKSFPIDDNSCEVVYASHLLEHLTRKEAMIFLENCYRVLKPGGLIRIVVPDLEVIARLYIHYLDLSERGDIDSLARHEWMTLELLDQLTREEKGGEILKYFKQTNIPAKEFAISRMGAEVKKLMSVKKYTNSNNLKSDDNAGHFTSKNYLKFRESGELHKWMYDKISLSNLMSSIGFQMPNKCTATESRIKNFTKYSLDSCVDGIARKPDSLYLEATK